MKIGIYSPYFDATGGGERYMLTLAEALAPTHDVHLIWDDSGLRDRAMEKFGIDLSGTKVVHNFIRGNNVLKKSGIPVDMICLFIFPMGVCRFRLPGIRLCIFRSPYTA
jgi:hypothetical protein